MTWTNSTLVPWGKRGSVAMRAPSCLPGEAVRGEVICINEDYKMGVADVDHGAFDLGGSIGQIVEGSKNAA